MIFHPHKLDNNTLHTAKKMGVIKSDLIKYGTDFVGAEQSTGNDLGNAILQVAKMMDVSNEDIIKYGRCPSDNGLTETDADKIKRLLNND